VVGIDVVLVQVGQKGTSPKGRRIAPVDSVLDESGEFAQICGSSKLPMLNRFDAYGTTILTIADMPQFISEIDQMRHIVKRDQQLNLLAAVRGLAVRCGGSGSMELHLEGD
jgi:hypothetical protein